jgi:S-DNA-T family DNA segregation ATPase FtsK/SpoIIIE
VQIAVLGGAAARHDADASGAIGGGLLGAHEAEAIRSLAALPAEHPAPPVRSLPERQPLAGLPVTAGGLPVIGIDRATLAPVGLPNTGTLLVAGPASSGRSTALVTIVRALARWRPDARLFYLGAKARSAVADDPAFTACARGPAEVAALADELSGGVALLPTGPGGPPMALLVEGVPEFGFGSAADLALQRLLKVAVEAGHLVIGEGEIGAMSRTSPLSEIIRSGRTGILLQPQPMHAMALQADLPRGTRQGDFPIGSGALITRGSPEFVQLAVPD